jgi:ATP-dependent DNA helicase RecG
MQQYLGCVCIKTIDSTKKYSILSESFISVQVILLDATCQSLTGVGPALAKKLQACGITTIQDLLFHLPRQYQDRTRVTAIRDVRTNDWCVLVGQVNQVKVNYVKRKTLTCTLVDKTGQLSLRFFHFNQAQLAQLQQAPYIRVFGEARITPRGLEMVHPEYQLVNDVDDCAVETHLTPIYPATLGLSQTRLRQMIKQALTQYHSLLDHMEWLSVEELHRLELLPLPQALVELHQPMPNITLSSLENGSHPGLKRLAFDELLAKRLSLEFARRERAALTAPALPQASSYIQALLAHLPFTLTQAQQRVQQDISADLARHQPMLRLVQGDVGAGKTVIAALAALQSIAQGYQVAFMAPTDLLSEQHYHTLHHWFSAIGISVMRLSGKMPAKARREVISALARKECLCVVGTHALFQESVVFAQLGLVIIDEQHRFGVEQRSLLQKKADPTALTAHQLLLTATPIPRTLQMTHFAHMDLSIIDELPPGRTPIITSVLNQTKREQLIQRLAAAIAEGKQAYWVCTLIEESDNLQCIAATTTAEQLQAQLPLARVGLIHGRMKILDKEHTMRAFKQGDIDLLVATTVIEVGVDVANASVMVIENAERLGLSQLHQLRGRVGRGSQQSHCLLLYQPPLSAHALQRLQLLRDTTDGFVIAEKDLSLRGAGQLLGTQQTGRHWHQIAELPRDAALLTPVNQYAQQLLQHAPQTAYQLTQRWLGEFANYLQT